MAETGTTTDSKTHEDKEEDFNDSFDAGEGTVIGDKLSLYVFLKRAEGGDPVELLIPSASPPCPTVA